MWNIFIMVLYFISAWLPVRRLPIAVCGLIAFIIVLLSISACLPVRWLPIAQTALITSIRCCKIYKNPLKKIFRPKCILSYINIMDVLHNGIKPSPRINNYAEINCINGLVYFMKCYFINNIIKLFKI